jgi:hypothetical protein
VKKNVRNFDKTVLSLRLKSSEAIRFWNLMDKAKERNSYADKSDVIRELLGLQKPFVLTELDIEYFRQGKKAAEPSTTVPKDSESDIPRGSIRFSDQQAVSLDLPVGGTISEVSEKTIDKGKNKKINGGQ